MKTLLRLIAKDLQLEARRKELIVLLGSLSLLLCLIVALGVNSGFFPQNLMPKLYVPLLWVISVFLTTLALGRCFEYELEHRAIDALLLCGVSPAMFFLSKTISNFVVMFLGQLLTVFVLAAFLDVQIYPSLLGLIAISALVMFGLSALGTLLSALSMSSRLKGMLLPLISLPLCFPIYFCALELGWQVLGQEGLVWGSIWLNLLIFLDLMYMLLGLGLFKSAIRE